jgi:hypothetical protein
MISFSLFLSNPFSNRWANIYNRTIAVSKNMTAEIEVYRDNTIVSLMFRWAIRQSHGGVMLDIGVLGYSVSVQCYDNRHWNAEAGRYYNYGEEGNEA